MPPHPFVGKAVCLLLLLPLLLGALPADGYAEGKLFREKRRMAPILSTDNNNNNESEGFWRRTLSRGKDSVNKLTGEDAYQFGDVSRWIDAKVKDQVNKVTQKDDYEFGDLSRWIDAKVKDRVNEMTGKSSYDFGDLSKAIATRVISRRYVLEDIVILLKALVSLNVSMSSVASFLPVKLLVDLLNYSLAADVGNRVVAALAIEVDKRVKEALTGDANYQLGDYTKRAVLRFIGKDDYEFGDISRKIVANMEFDEGMGASDEGASNGDQDATSRLEPPPLLFAAGDDGKEVPLSESGGKTGEVTMAASIDPFILRELEQWDAAFEKRQMAEATRAAGSSSSGGGGDDD